MRMTNALAGSLLAAVVLGVPHVNAAQPSTTVQLGPDAPYDSVFAGMKYRLIGPFRGGRADGVSGVAQQPNVYYFGSASGGLWKTTDAGTTWKPLWDHFPEASPSVGAVEVAPSDPNVVYVGTGEANIRGNVVTGNGIYKSTDAGKTWKFIGLRDSEAVGRLAVNPTDPDTVLVAALGHPFGANSERGIYRTRDGGKTWQRVLYVDDKTGGIDVQYDPADPNIVYAGMWQVIRRPWIFASGGPGSGLYRSTDGGTTWHKLTGHGLPAGIWGKVGVAPTPDRQRIYALIEAKAGGLYRTDDGGASWKLINDSDLYRQRAWYYTAVFADPKDANKVYIMNTGAYKSTDGGKTFKKMPTFHGDNHSLWINPTNPDLMVNSNDGGADVSVDGGDSWTSEMNQPTAQFYHIAVDDQIPYHIYGAQQDNTTVETLSADTRGPIGELDWHSVGGGESGYVVPQPGNPNIVIANGYGGNVDRYNTLTGEIDPINPWARQVMGWAPKDLEHRSQWTEPLAFSPHDPNVLYNADEVLFESTDLGQSWRVISPDLTRNDKSKQLSSGGPLTKDNTDIETYDTIFSVVESPVQQGLIWAGTDDGLIRLTTDGGVHWRNVTPKEMPAWGTVDMVEADPHEAGTAYIAVDCHRLDDFRPHAFRTDDFGKTWVSITRGIPDGSYVHAVRVDPARAGLLYAATETGIFVSFDDGARWQPLQLNLPRVPVHDLVVHDGDLAVASHGRSFWVLDDLSPIRQWSDSTRNEDFHLFTPRTTRRMLYSGFGDMTGTSTGANPPAGVVVDYYLASGTAPTSEDKGKGGAADGKSSKRVKIEFLDAGGQVIRTFPDPYQPKKEKGADDDFRGPKPVVLTANAGLNRFVWDMRYAGSPAIPKTAMWAASLQGPVALPGHYQVRVTVDGKSETQPFEITPDPRLHVTQAELQRQFDLGMAIRGELRQVQDALLQIRALHARLASIRDAVAADKIPRGSRILRAANDLERKTTAVEDKMIQRKSVASEDPLNFPIRLNNMIASLNALVERGSSAPTQADMKDFDQLQAMAAEDLRQWDRAKGSDLAALNALLAKSGQPAITLH
ncbi:MAG: glycosyl hydrolase [Gammaproteobacteria bacterium]|nr:glycosyl hydrolase [Gammaproteobacteria bacterium]